MLLPIVEMQNTNKLSFIFSESFAIKLILIDKCRFTVLMLFMALTQITLKSNCSFLNLKYSLIITRVKFYR